MILPNTRKVLPLVYDECLSYYEQLIALINGVNNLIENFNELENNSIIVANEYTDKKTNELSVEIENVKNDLLRNVSELEQKFFNELSNNKTLTDAQIADLTAEFNDMRIMLEDSIIKLNLTVSNLFLVINKMQETQSEELEKIKLELVEFIKENLSTKSGDFILVVNPITGKISDLTTTLECIYNNFSIVGAITAFEFDNMKITAQEFDNLKISAKLFDSKAFFIFFDKIKLNPLWDKVVKLVDSVNVNLLKVENLSFILSPFTGLKTKAGEVVQQLADLHKNCYTASEYDSIGITAQSYDNLQITAFEYDWNSKNII